MGLRKVFDWSGRFPVYVLFGNSCLFSSPVMQSRKTIYAYYGFACSEFGKGGALYSQGRNRSDPRGDIFLVRRSRVHACCWSVCSISNLDSSHVLPSRLCSGSDLSDGGYFSGPSLESVWGLFVRMWLNGSMEGPMP